MRCSHCCRPLRDGATFCSHCGVPVRAEAPRARGMRGPTASRVAVPALDLRRAASVVGGTLVAAATLLPWAAVPFVGNRNAFNVGVGFPLGVLLVVCGGVAAALTLLDSGERWRRGATATAAIAVGLFCVLVDGGLDAAGVGAVVAVVGVVLLGASTPGPARQNATPVTGGQQFEEVV